MDFEWPTSRVLIRRAERSLNVSAKSDRRAVGPIAESVICADLSSRLDVVDQTITRLVAPGYESSGRFVRLKRDMKRVIRRTVWWYVEPRWDVQRALTSDLATIARGSLNLVEQMTLEIQDLRDLVDELSLRLPDPNK